VVILVGVINHAIVLDGKKNAEKTAESVIEFLDMLIMPKRKCIVEFPNVVVVSQWSKIVIDQETATRILDDTTANNIY
jgi:hypothetical protein